MLLIVLGFTTRGKDLMGFILLSPMDPRHLMFIVKWKEVWLVILAVFFFKKTNSYLLQSAGFLIYFFIKQTCCHHSLFPDNAILIK